MKKIILLSTAAALLSPLAAKANSKSSIMVGLKGMWERLATGDASAAGENMKKAHEGENFLSGGLEAYYTHKVWKNLQVAAGASLTYIPSHTFSDTNKALLEQIGANAERGSRFGFSPRVMLGWAMPVANDVEITPFLGTGVDATFFEQETAGKKEWTSQWKMPVLLGARVNYSYFYASLAGRFDVTATDLFESRDVGGAKSDARFGGIEFSIGAEF